MHITHSSARSLCLLALFLLAGVPAAQAQFQLAGSVFGTGNTITTDGRYRLVGTFGQPLTGPSFDAAFAVAGGFWTRPGAVATAVEPIEDSVVPEAFHLAQNYPNPFNPTTRIAFSVPQTSPVRLAVFDVLGRAVAMLVNAPMSAGRYEVTFDAHGLPSGLYVYVVEMGRFRAQKKMVLMK